MNELVAQVGSQNVAGFFLVLARLSPLFLLAPLFSSRSIPMRARGVVAVALAVGLAPIALRGGPPVPLDVAAFAGLVVKELLVGLAFAFALTSAMGIAGALLDTFIGFSFGLLVDPLTGQSSSILYQLYGLVGVLIFITIGGDEWVIRGVAATYDLAPLTEVPSIGHLVSQALEVFTSLFWAALQVAAPVILAVVLTDAAFAVVSRVVPQLNVFAVGFPIKIAVGLLVVAASLPFVAGFVAEGFESRVSDAVRMFGG